MKTKSLMILSILVLAGCTTPRTLLSNARTGQTATCGGSVTPIGLFYYMQKSSDSDCVADYTAQGFTRVYTNQNSESK